METQELQEGIDAVASPRRAAGGEKLVGALVAGLSIVRHLNAAAGAQGVTQIARALSLNPSTCFQLLKTLVHEDLLVFDPATKTYGLGLGLLELASGALGQGSYAGLVHPHLGQIARRHNVTATLWQRLGRDRAVLVGQAECDRPVGVSMSIGQRLPLTLGAMGRCMAAVGNLSKEELRRTYADLRWQTAPGFARYWREVEAARRDGYAIDVDNFVKGVTSISSAVPDRMGEPLLAISATGFSAQFTAKSLVALAQEVRAHAAEVAQALAGGASQVSVKRG